MWLWGVSKLRSTVKILEKQERDTLDKDKQSMLNICKINIINSIKLTVNHADTF